MNSAIYVGVIWKQSNLIFCSADKDVYCVCSYKYFWLVASVTLPNDDGISCNCCLRLAGTLSKKVKKKKVKCSRYRPGVAQRVGRGIALLFHGRCTRRAWVVSSTPQPHFIPGGRPGTHFIGGWVGPRFGLDGRESSSPPGFDPGPASP